MHYIITGGDRLVVDSPLDSMTTNSQKNDRFAMFYTRR